MSEGVVLDPTRLIAGALIGLIILLILIIKFKVQAMIAILVGAISIGIVAGMPLSDIITSVNDGIGNTLKGIALLVGLGSMFGAILEASGGAQTLAVTMVKKFGDEKGMNYTIQMSLEFSKMFFRTPDKRDLLPKYNPMLKHWALKMVCCTPLPIKYPCKNLLLENRDNRFVTDKFIVMTGHTCL